MADFFLSFDEIALSFDPAACTVVDRIRTQVGKEMVRVRLDPPVPEFYFGSERRELLLMARYTHESLCVPLPTGTLTVNVFGVPADYEQVLSRGESVGPWANLLHLDIGTISTDRPLK